MRCFWMLSISFSFSFLQTCNYYVDFFIFILFEIYPPFWICSLYLSPNLGSFQPLFLWILSQPCSFFSFWDAEDRNVNAFPIVSRSLRIWRVFFPVYFSLCYWDWKILLIWPHICWFYSQSSSLCCWVCSTRVFPCSDSRGY